MEQINYRVPENQNSLSKALIASYNDGDIPVVNLIGELDLSSAPRLYNELWQVTQDGKKSVALNLAKLEFMDSSGLQLLLRLREKLKAKNQEIILINPQPSITKLLQLTGFDKLFKIQGRT